MISTITAPFVDTRAADLVLSLAAPELPAVAVRTIQIDDAQVELRLLKASHQVAVRRGSNKLIETLACLPTDPAGLPEQYRTQCAMGDYDTSVSVRELDVHDLTTTVEELLARYSEDERYVIGRFPGDPLATTGVGLVAAAPGTIAWRSWHAYPQEQRLVLTDSMLRLRVADRTPERVAG